MRCRIWVSALIVLLIFYVLARLLRRAAVRVYARLFPRNKTGKLVGSLVYGAMCFSGVVLALEILNLASFITHMLAGAGIIGIIAGFALKDVASKSRLPAFCSNRSGLLRWGNG